MKTTKNILGLLQVLILILAIGIVGGIAGKLIVDIFFEHFLSIFSLIILGFGIKCMLVQKPSKNKF